MDNGSHAFFSALPGGVARQVYDGARIGSVHGQDRFIGHIRHGQSNGHGITAGRFTGQGHAVFRDGGRAAVQLPRAVVGEHIGTGHIVHLGGQGLQRHAGGGDAGILRADHGGRAVNVDSLQQQADVQLFGHRGGKGQVMDDSGVVIRGGTFATKRVFAEKALVHGSSYILLTMSSGVHSGWSLPAWAGGVENSAKRWSLGRASSSRR